MPNKKICIEQDELIRLYVEQKLSSIEIAEIFNCSSLTVINRLKEYGIEVRTISEANKGKQKSKESNLRRSESWTVSRRNEQSMRTKGVQKPRPGAVGKKIHSEKYKDYLSEKFSGKNNPMFGRTGKSNPNWKPLEECITPLYKLIRNSAKYVSWRTSIFIRDNYTCTFCFKHGGRLQVDHIKQFALIVNENNISSKEEAENCEELWRKENARTLCYKCHRTTDTWGKKLK